MHLPVPVYRQVTLSPTHMHLHYHRLHPTDTISTRITPQVLRIRRGLDVIAIRQFDPVGGHRTPLGSATSLIPPLSSHLSHPPPGGPVDVLSLRPLRTPGGPIRAVIDA